MDYYDSTNSNRCSMNTILHVKRAAILARPTGLSTSMPELDLRSGLKDKVHRSETDGQTDIQTQGINGLKVLHVPGTLTCYETCRTDPTR